LSGSEQLENPDYTVYMIKSEEGFRYIGFTSDFNKRLIEHNSGLSQWTKRGSNWRLVYHEKFKNKTDAIKRERWLKSGHGRQFLDSTVKDS